VTGALPRTSPRTIALLASGQPALNEKHVGTRERQGASPHLHEIVSVPLFFHDSVIAVAVGALQNVRNFVDKDVGQECGNQGLGACGPEAIVDYADVDSFVRFRARERPHALIREVVLHDLDN
jgi:hypothetical protein